MDGSLRPQIDSYLAHLHGLIERGCALRDALGSKPSDAPAAAATRAWQTDCGAIINQLSGGSKSHWLARAYSEAFLIRSQSGAVVELVAASEIVNRLVGVLEQAVRSLSSLVDRATASGASEPSPGPRFEFVHNPDLRAVVEQAYRDSRREFERGRYAQSLLVSCGVLEAIVTDALEHGGHRALAPDELPPGKITDWSFEQRLTVAEKAGLIHGECARLPQIARGYRNLTANDGQYDPQAQVSERDARQVGQVLRVVMRDLDPGRR